MKNVTLSAEESLIDRARLIAQSRHTTLNEEFRRWLEDYTAREGMVEQYDALMKRLRGKVVSAGPYTRDEMNER